MLFRVLYVEMCAQLRKRVNFHKTLFIPFNRSSNELEMEKRLKSNYGDDSKKCETKPQRSLASIEQRNAQIRRVGNFLNRNVSHISCKHTAKHNHLINHHLISLAIIFVFFLFGIFSIGNRNVTSKNALTVIVQPIGNTFASRHRRLFTDNKSSQALN